MTGTAWYERPFAMFQTNLRETDTAFDVDKVLDYVEEHGANTWLVNAGGILAFHPTDLACQTRNPFLANRPSGDLLGDAVAAAHARGMRVMARMDFSKIVRDLAEEYPHWCYVDRHGSWQEYNGLVSVCPNGDYYQRATFGIIDEVLDRYPVDGFFFNWFSFNEVDYSKVRRGACHCAACRAGFEAASGLALPDSPNHAAYRPWQRWTEEILDDLTTRLRKHITDRAPDVGLLGRDAEIIFHEANNAVGRPLWHHATSEAVSAAKAVRASAPVLVNSVSFLDMPYRMASEDPEHFAQYLMQTIARGGNPSTYIMGVPVDIPLACLDVAAELTRFHRDHHDIYDGLVSDAGIAVVRPDELAVEPAAAQEARREFRGVLLALQEGQLPFDVIPQAVLVDVAESRGLHDYDVVVLPDLRILSGAEAEVIDAFVESGGRLLATGSSGCSGDEVLLTSLGVRRRLAYRDNEEMLRASYVRRGERGDVDWAMLPLYGAYSYMELEEGATPHLNVLAPAPYGPPEKCYGQRTTGHPGWVAASYGAGSTALVPWTIGRTYADLGLREIRDLLLDVLVSLMPEQGPIDVALPEQVEVVLGRNDDQCVLHLLNHSGVTPVSFRPPVAIHGGSIRLRGRAGQTARAHVVGQLCETEDVGDDLVVHLPVLDRFEVVTVAADGES